MNLTTAEYNRMMAGKPGFKPLAPAKPVILRSLDQSPIPAERSPLELRFLDLWRLYHGPELVEEYQFHPERKFRADFAHLPSRTLYECEGGIYKNGRHNNPKGFVDDAVKYLEAGLAGWRVYRLPSVLIRGEIIQRLIVDCKRRMS